MPKTKKFPGFEYKWVNISLIPYGSMQEPAQGATIEEAANYWAGRGWRTVSVIPAKGPGYSDTLLVERIKQNPHNQIGGIEEFKNWMEWEKTFGSTFDG